LHSPTRSGRLTSEARAKLFQRINMDGNGAVLIVIFFVSKRTAPGDTLRVNPNNYCEKIFTIFLTFDHINDGKHVLQFDK
jgi:hypothetical protein